MKKLIWLLILSAIVITSSAQSTVSYSEGVLFLLPTSTDDDPSFNNLFPLDLSSNGAYIAAIATRREEEIGFTVLLWELDVMADVDTAIVPPPTRRRDFSLIHRDNVWLAFSPDGERLVIRSPGYVQLLNVPKLEITHTLEDDAVNRLWRLAWSSDGEYLALGYDERLAVWDFAANMIYETDIEAEYGRITAFQSHWFLSESLNPTWALLEYYPDRTFTICDWNVQTCESHPTEASVVVPLVTRNQVITQTWTDGIPYTEVWEPTGENCCRYQPQAVLDYLAHPPRSISSAAHNDIYLITINRDTTAILEYDTGSIVQADLPFYTRPPGIISDGDYYIVLGGGLPIYRHGDTELLDKSHISSFALWDEALELYGITEIFEVQGAISEGGIWMLLTYGDFSVVLRADIE